MSYSPSLKRFTEIRLPSFSSLRKDLSLLKTLYYNLKCGNYYYPVRIYPNVHIHISRSAKIIRKGGC